MRPRLATCLLPLPLALVASCGSAPTNDGPALPGLEQLQADVQRGNNPIVSSTGNTQIDQRAERNLDGRPAFSDRSEEAAEIGRLIVDCDRHLRAWTESMAQVRDPKNQELVQYTTQSMGVLVAKNRGLLESQAVSGAARNRGIACAALGFSGDNRVTPLLLNGVSNGEPDVIAKALLGLGVLADPFTSMAPIHAAVIDPNATSEIHSNAAFAIFQIAIKTGVDSDGTMVSALLSLINSPDPSVRAQSTLSLGLIHANIALPQLTDMLAGDMAPDVRTAAAYGLGQIGSTASTQPLVNALRDPSGLTAGAARAALVRIHGRDLGPDPDSWRPLMTQ
ncbi:MAG: HEAT repeat domain-containing protein [Planctomycetota bacterium]|nr:HEAT repeat domain-containing protein [Planctomycetota bacterium]